jgi:hypothetical protein
MYKITNYSKEQAKKLGVKIKPSTLKNKKIDVFKGDKKVASIGAIDYNDYPTYIKKFGRAYADDRRRLYKLRHEKYRNIPDTPSFYSDKILW